MKKKTKEKNEGWSDKYKKSIDCNNPKGFSQKAHCAGKKKNEMVGAVPSPSRKGVNKMKKKGNTSVPYGSGYKKIKELMEDCRAFLYAGTEDFGIAPVEAMAAGSPIIAYGNAGILDTVNCINTNSETPTGILFENQSHDALKDCVQYFEDKKIWKKFSNTDINKWAQNFGIDSFQKKFSLFLNQSLIEFYKK